MPRYSSVALFAIPATLGVPTNLIFNLGNGHRSSSPATFLLSMRLILNLCNPQCWPHPRMLPTPECCPPPNVAHPRMLPHQLTPHNPQSTIPQSVAMLNRS